MDKRLLENVVHKNQTKAATAKACMNLLHIGRRLTGALYCCITGYGLAEENKRGSKGGKYPCCVPSGGFSLAVSLDEAMVE